jgi:hypothetical protein
MRNLLFVFLLTSSPLFAQMSLDTLDGRDSYILNYSTYKKGIYKTFEEFKYNRPSITDNFIFDGKRLYITDKATGRTKKVRKGEVWGLSNGSRIFVRHNKYNEILFMGRYCFFIERGTRIFFSFSTIPPMIIPIPYPYKDELIINFNTGNTYVLSKAVVKEILQKDDPDLFMQFKEERRKGKKLQEYIIEYNKRNEARIK